MKIVEVPSSKQLIIANQNTKQLSQKKKKAKNAQKSMRSPSNSRNLDEASEFYNAMLYPDLVGPIRIPRVGGSCRTGLGMDRTRMNVGPSSATACAGLVYMGHYTISGGGPAIQLSAVTVDTPLTAGAGTVPGTQFPASTNITDINMTAGCMILNYFGTPLNAQGEIIIGTLPQGVAPSSTWTNVTYTSLAFVPGVMRIPVSSLVTQPLRIAMKKVSPVADAFHATTGTIDDFEHPFFLITGAPSTVSISVDIFRNWEYRTAIVQANVVPYERTGPSFVSDSNAYVNALAEISELPQTVTEGYSQYVREIAESAIGQIPGIIRNLAPHALHYAQNRVIQNMRGGNLLRNEL